MHCFECFLPTGDLLSIYIRPWRATFRAGIASRLSQLSLFPRRSSDFGHGPFSIGMAKGYLGATGPKRELMWRLHGAVIPLQRPVSSNAVDLWARAEVIKSGNKPSHSSADNSRSSASSEWVARRSMREFLARPCSVFSHT